MKLDRLFAILLVAGGFGLFGCKPSETLLSGQVFIVTKGADNVKLGAVEILLIQRQQVADYLRDRESIIDGRIKAAQQALDNALDAIETAKTNAAAARKNYDAAFVDLYKSPKYLKITAQRDALARAHLDTATIIKREG